MLFEIMINSTTLHNIVPVSVVLPEKKGRLKNNSGFPSLFLLHGMLGDHTDWLKRTDIIQLAEDYGFVAIMPYGKNSFYIDNKKSGENYSQFIQEELPEKMGMILPITKEREFTFLAGASMGGYGSLRNGILGSARFGYAAGFSSGLLEDVKDKNDDCISEEYYFSKTYFETLFGDLKRIEGGEYDIKHVVAEAIRNKHDFPNIYLACGTEDMVLEQNHHLRDFLEKNDIKHVYKETAGNHNFDFWNMCLNDIVKNWLPLYGYNE